MLKSIVPELVHLRAVLDLILGWTDWKNGAFHREDRSTLQKSREKLGIGKKQVSTVTV